MENDRLIEALLSVSVETGSLACLGCGHEHNCGIHGCAILREVAERYTDLQKRWEALNDFENGQRAKLLARIGEKDRQLAAAVERQAELDDALRDMVGQYCSFGGKLDHEFMSAGEKAFDVLDLEYGAPTETLWCGPQEAGEVEHAD